MENIIDREIAWRIFAYEFNRSNLYYSEGDERAPNYIITPTGVKCNRLFIVGVVTEIENIGAENNLWRARIADPTGVFTIYAGQYQPEAAIFLSELSVPAYVAVVGKARKYEPEEGSVYTSIRPEEINYADEKLRDRWVLDTAERTLERIKIMEDVLSSGLSGNELKDYLLRKGTNTVFTDGVVRAISHYKNLDKIIAELKKELIHAVETVLSERVKTGTPEQQIEKRKESQMNSDERRSQELRAEGLKAEGPKAEGLKIMESKAEGLRAEELKAEKQKEIVTEPQSMPDIPGEVKTVETEPKEVLAGIIERLDTGRGTSYAMVIEAAISSGIDTESTEAGIKELMAEGRCYEPKIGVLRKV